MSPAKRPATAATPVDGILTLFEIGFSHAYFNRQDGACPGLLRAQPTKATAAAMARLGLSFHARSTGFAVCVPQSRVAALAAFVANSARPQAAPAGCWAWLSFEVAAEDSGFLGMTAVPLDFAPAAAKFHVSNLATAKFHGGLRFAGTAPRGQRIYPVRGPKIAAPASEGHTAQIVDLSGQPLAIAPGGSPAAPAFDLSAQPYGFYTLQYVPQAAKGAAAPGSFVYAAAGNAAFCTIDLVLAQPAADAGDPSAFPLPPPDGTAQTPQPQSVALDLAFDARSTLWRYYVVSQAARGRLASDVAISGTAATFAKSAATLPNGERALAFSADKPLPLRQASPYRFALAGHRKGKDGSKDPIAVAHLPTASPQNVWPDPGGNAMAGLSEIYVYL